jgi:hypothetical protein
MDKSSFQKWYDKHKGELAEKRALRYRNDPEYRQAALTRSRIARASRPRQEVPSEYSHTMAGAAEEVGVTIWTLREWRKKNYFPEPKDIGGKKWFTQNQVNLMNSLRGFFEENGIRVSARVRPALEGLISLIYSNW